MVKIRGQNVEFGSVNAAFDKLRRGKVGIESREQGFEFGSVNADCGIIQV